MKSERNQQLGRGRREEKKCENCTKGPTKASTAKTAKDAAATVKAAKKAAKEPGNPAPFAKPMNVTGAGDDLIEGHGSAPDRDQTNALSSRHEDSGQVIGVRRAAGLPSENKVTDPRFIHVGLPRLASSISKMSLTMLQWVLLIAFLRRCLGLGVEVGRFSNAWLLISTIRLLISRLVEAMRLSSSSDSSFVISGRAGRAADPEPPSASLASLWNNSCAPWIASRGSMPGSSCFLAKTAALVSASDAAPGSSLVDLHDVLLLRHSKAGRTSSTARSDWYLEPCAVRSCNRRPGTR